MNPLQRHLVCLMGLSWLSAATAFASTATTFVKDRTFEDLDGLAPTPTSGSALVALAGLLLLIGLVSVRRKGPYQD